MTALQSIIKEAKAIRKKNPKMEWKKAVAQASAIYASKHKGKSPVGKKHAKKKTAKKVAGYVRTLRQGGKTDVIYTNAKASSKVKKYSKALKTFPNSPKQKKLFGVKKKPTEKAVLKSIKHAVSVQKAHMSGVSHHAIERIKSAMSHLSHYEMAVKKYMALPLKERKMYASNIKKLRHLVKETKTHISQLKKSI